MDRLRRFLEAGITCFIDLTEPDESPAYDRHLPFETSSGRRIDYRRQPIPDHGVPADRATMDRILAMLDDALATGHCVYLHCRAGIGRSATVAGCWLAERNPGGGEAALTELGDYWQQCRQSRSWPQVPETSEQEEFVRTWQSLRPGMKGVAKSSGQARGLALEQRVRGGWFGLALGDALGATSAAVASKSSPLAWTQHTSLALCLAESLSVLGRSDARDQIERYWRWFKDGHLTATGQPGETGASPDVAKALATFRWRGLAVAGSHDPKDAAATSLPRVLAAALFAGNNPAAAIALAAECSRTTHQSPLVLDTCRAYSAMLLCALRGQPAQDWLRAVPEPCPGAGQPGRCAKTCRLRLPPCRLPKAPRRPVARSTWCRRSHSRVVSPATQRISMPPSLQQDATWATKQPWSPGSSARCSACSTASMPCPRTRSAGLRAAPTSTLRSNTALRA